MPVSFDPNGLHHTLELHLSIKAFTRKYEKICFIHFKYYRKKTTYSLVKKLWSASFALFCLCFDPIR